MLRGHATEIICGRVDQFVCVLAAQLTLTHICAPVCAAAWDLPAIVFFLWLQLLINYIDCPTFWLAVEFYVILVNFFFLGNFCWALTHEAKGQITCGSNTSNQLQLKGQFKPRPQPKIFIPKHIAGQSEQYK